MRIRTNMFVTLDGNVSGPDGRPVQLLMIELGYTIESR
jgi:hypothetical protein